MFDPYKVATTLLEILGDQYGVEFTNVSLRDKNTGAVIGPGTIPQSAALTAPFTQGSQN